MSTDNALHCHHGNVNTNTLNLSNWASASWLGSRSLFVFFLLASHIAARGQAFRETLLGGSARDTALAVAETAGGYYVVGVTESEDFPVTDGSVARGAKDLFVAKVGRDGVLIAATRLGGSGDDQATGVVVDSSGLVTVSGWTTSTNFPTVAPIQAANAGMSDGLIIQLNPDLTVPFATYHGGSGDDQFAGVAHEVMTDGFVFGGFTTSTDFPFPSPNGANADTSKSFRTDTDGLLVVLQRNRTVRLATYHGLNGSNEIINAVAADPSGAISAEAGEVAVTGWTDHAQFYGRGTDPRGAGRKLFGGLISSVTGARLNSRVRGGAGDDEGLAVAYSAGLIRIAGSTTSTDFPVSGNAPQKTYGGGARDGVIVAFETEGDFDNWATYLGGSGDDQVRGLRFDPAGHLHFAGTTSSADFPVRLAATEPTPQSNYGGGASDGFMGRIQIGKTGFGVFEGVFPSLTFVGGGEEDGFLAAGFAVDGAGASEGDPYLGLAAGGRRFAPAPSNASRNAGRADVEGDPDEQALLAFFQKFVGAEADIAISGRWVPAPPTRDREPATLEITLTNHGPLLDSGPVEFILLDDSESRSAQEYVFPAEYDVKQLGYTYTGVVRVQVGNPLTIPVQVRATLVPDRPTSTLIHSSAIDLRLRVTGAAPDPNTGNNQAAVPRAIIYEPDTATVSGKAFNDTNGNGLLDDGESVLEGTVVRLVDRENRRSVDIVAKDGSFLFEGLPPGVYAVGGDGIVPKIIRVAANDRRSDVFLAKPPSPLPDGVVSLSITPVSAAGPAGSFISWKGGADRVLARSSTLGGTFEPIPMVAQPVFVTYDEGAGFFQLAAPPANP